MCIHTHIYSAAGVTTTRRGNGGGQIDDIVSHPPIREQPIYIIGRVFKTDQHDTVISMQLNK